MLDNPTRFIDPDGKAPEDIIILFATTGNGHGDELFNAAMNTRKNNLGGTLSVINGSDIVITRNIQDLGDIAGEIAAIQEQYGEEFGQVRELGIWSHSGFDGPTGTETTSSFNFSEYSSQMSLEGWANLDVNWKESGATCSFYGCNSGSGGDRSFANSVSGLPNMSGVTVLGQISYSYPSTFTDIRQTNITRSASPSLGFSIGDTYMVGGSRGEGASSMWYRSTKNAAKPMQSNKNGRKTGAVFQDGRRYYSTF